MQEETIKIGCYYTVPEAAGELGVHPETVRLAVKQERLLAVRAFGKLLIGKSDVEAYRARTQPDGVKRVGRPPKAEQGESDRPGGHASG